MAEPLVILAQLMKNTCLPSAAVKGGLQAAPKNAYFKDILVLVQIFLFLNINLQQQQKKSISLVLLYISITEKED